MNALLVIYLILSTTGLGMSVALHGQPRKPVNGWHAFIAFCVGQALVWGIYLTA